MLRAILKILRTVFIGPTPAAVGHADGGIAEFIQFELNYKSLLLRLLVVVVPWLIFWWLGWSTLSSVSFLALEVYASLLAIRFVAGVSQRGQIGPIWTAMWLPIVVAAVAAYLLFLNDQGRELGVGLMDPNEKGLYLGVVLVYWAANNWLSARVGLSRVFSGPGQEQILLFWGPRLVGVLAHLLAAFSLSAAAWSQPALHATPARWLAFSAPLAILLATVFVWHLDYAYVSQRSNPQRQPVARNWMLAVAAIELILFAGLVVVWWLEVVPAGFFWATLFITVSAIIFLALISILRREQPLAPDASAEERENDKRREQRVTLWWTAILAAIMVIGTIVIWKRPMQIGHYFGSLTIACFSFGSFLALISLLDLLTERLADYARSAGFAVSRSALAALFVCFLVVPALLASLTHTFHRVRLCDVDHNKCTAAALPKTKGWSAVQTPDGRPSVEDAAGAWYRQAELVYHAAHPGKPVPMLVVATAGGGIRAAYWTATVLEQLEQDLNGKVTGPSGEILTENPLHNLLFAISGVSGGSVGAAAYAAAVHDHEVTGAPIKPTGYLRQDFLAPGLAGLVFIDGPANLLPDLGQIDRGQALELGFELASGTPADTDGLVSHRFLSFFPTMAAVQETKSWRPALLLNATHQETGRRIITSHIKVERDAFLDSYDALQVLGADVRLSTAAHNSARFTYVSPAGGLVDAQKRPRNNGYVIDGGYFENFGAETALELARKAIDAIESDESINPEHKRLVKLVVLQISSDPSLKRDRTLVRTRPNGSEGCTVTTFGTAGPSNYLHLDKDEGEGYVFSWANELSAPLIGVTSVRQAHGTVAADELAASICQQKVEVEKALKNTFERNTTAYTPIAAGPPAGIGSDAPHFSHAAMCETSDHGGAGIVPPLGWVLSDRTRGKFKDILGDCGNGQELTSLEQALGHP
jgi:hypothetical protein